MEKKVVEKTVSVYGKMRQAHTYRQRYRKWTKGYVRKDGVKVKAYKKRVWKTVTRKQRVGKERRFDVTGTKEELKKIVAMIKEDKLIPRKRFEKAEAKEFLEHPEEYSREEEEDEEWVEEEESPWKCCQCGAINHTITCGDCGHERCKDCG